MALFDRSRQLSLCLFMLGAFAFSTEANAQAQAPGFSLDSYDPADRGSDWFSLDSLDLRGELRGAAGLTLDWGYRPLVEYQPNGKSTPLVENQLFAHVGGSLVFLDRFRLGLNLPIALYANGTAAAVGGTLYGNPSSQALGDLRLGGDVRIYGVSGELFTLAGGLQVFIPTGSQSAYAGDGKARLLGRLQAAGKADWFVYAARLGWVWRPNAQVIDGIQTGSELQGGVSVGAKLLNDALTVGPELSASTTAWSTSTLFSTDSTPVEVVLGAHYQMGDFKLGAAVGPGLTRGLGAPEVRTLVSFEWAPLPPPVVIEAPHAATTPPMVEATPQAAPPPPPPDRDHDGIPDSEDACPDVPGVKTDDPKTNGCPPPPPDRDHDGIPDSEDACPDVPGVKTDDPKTNGCPLDTDHDGVPDAIDNCPTEPGPPENQGCPIKKKQLVVITKTQIEIHDRVYFATGKATIQKRSFGLLDQVAAVISSHPAIPKISVEGHTDDQGKAAKNRTLSQARAQSVRSYLIKKGVAGERLEAHGFGPDKPIDSNATDAGRANNRRVEFHLTDVELAPEPLSQ